MSVIAKQSTARTVIVGPILDADGVAVTDAVVGDLKLSKNGGAPGALNGSATLTHRNTGHYSLALTTSDLDTVGQAEVVIDDTTNAMPVKAITIVEEVIYDALFAASANAYAGSAGSSTLGSGAIAASSIASDAITAAKVASDVTTEIQSGLATAAELAKVPKSDGTATWNATALASINSQCDTALADYDGPTNAEMEARTIAAANYALEATLASMKGATFDTSTDSLEAIRNRGDSAWVTATGFSTLDAAGIRTAVGLASANLDTQLGDVPTVSEFNARTIVAADYATLANQTTIIADTGTTLPGLINGLNDLGTSDIETAVGTALATYDGPTKAELDAAVADLPTNAELAAAIITGLTTALSEGYRSTGATGSVRDMLYEILGHMGNSGIVGTLKTVKKLDKSTTAKTYTLDDGTTPTAIEETT